MSESKESEEVVRKVADRLRGVKRYLTVEPLKGEREGNLSMNSWHETQREAESHIEEVLRSRHDPVFPAIDPKTGNKVSVEHEIWVVRVEKVLTTKVQPEEQPGGEEDDDDK